MRKEEILSEISKILLPPFEELVFFSNKKKDNYIKKEDSFEFKFSIYIICGYKTYYIICNK